MAPEELNATEFTNLVKRLLENPLWLDGLDINTTYTRKDDDNPEDIESELQISINSNGDISISVYGKCLRFNNSSGGGRSLRTHAALAMLALAMKLDEEERPDNIKYQIP